MTTKEKANDLYFWFWENVKDDDGIKLFSGEISRICSLGVVDEILNNGGNFQGMSFGDNEMWIDRQYWEQVKEEINKL